MKEREIINNIISAITDLRVKYIKNMNSELYLLNNCCGGSLTNYLKINAKYKILTKVSKDLETILNDDFEF